MPKTVRNDNRFTLLIICAIFTLCKINSTQKNNGHIIEQEYIFEIQWVNQAWGYRLKGLYIDRKGNVFIYQDPKGGWIRERGAKTQEKTYSPSELQDRYDSAILVDSVDYNKLVGFFDQGQNLDTTQLSDLQDSGCRDMGVYSFLAYEYQPSMSIYKPIIIHMAGVVWQQNLSKNGVALYNWLLGLGEKHLHISTKRVESCGFQTYSQPDFRDLP